MLRDKPFFPICTSLAQSKFWHYLKVRSQIIGYLKVRSQIIINPNPNPNPNPIMFVFICAHDICYVLSMLK